MRTLERFATVCFIGAAFAAFVSACSSSDAMPPPTGTAGAGTAGAGTAGAGTAGAAAGGAPSAGAAGAPSAGAAGGSALIGDAARGMTLYSTNTVGCSGCHGKAGEGEFGPNITFSTTAGIGLWTQAQFQGAVRMALDKTGVKLYFLMPAIDATMLSDQGIADIYAFLKTQKVDTVKTGSFCDGAPGMCKGTR